MIILGIETSCDETGVALYDAERGLIAEALHSQAIHADFGGVVPELASRDHVHYLLPLVERVLQEANCTQQDLSAVAYTAGPGLAGALLVGAAWGRTLAWSLQIPAVPVHHLVAHVLIAELEAPTLTFPFLALLVSGGHTLFAVVESVTTFRILGETLDDAVGEAFDKTAKLLGLGYPGGAALARLASTGNPERFQFPRPLLRRPTLEMSFSGLKTAVLQQWRRSGEDSTVRADVAASFQAAIVDTLVSKSRRALEITGLTQLVVAGGVSANRDLRQALQDLCDSRQAALFLPRLAHCTDNGAMIAYAGSRLLAAGVQQNTLVFNVRPRWPLVAESASATTKGGF